MDSIIFPKSGVKKSHAVAKIRECIGNAPSWSDTEHGFRLGFPHIRLFDTAMDAYKLALGINPNHFGMHTRQKWAKLTTHRLEAETVMMLGNLYHDSHCDGYLTSGGTESNIMALWIARNSMRDFGNTCLITTELTHNSVMKAADILGLHMKKIKLDGNYSMSLEDLYKKIRSLRNNYRNFIIVATVGYTATGTSDDVSKISKTIRKLKNTGTRFYLHVDAAFAGLVLPFSKPEFVFDFRNKEVQSISVDMHKMGGVPYPAGVFLCRKGLPKAILSNPGHYKAEDDTLTGSRQGAISAACWSVIISLGRAGFSKIASECIGNKRKLMAAFKILDPNIVFISDENMNLFAASFSKSEGRLPRRLEEKYRLFPVTLYYNGKRRLFYKFYIMPHFRFHIIRDIILDFRKAGC